MTYFFTFIQFQKDLKFTEESRFIFGVCVIKDKDGKEIGKKLEPFDYTAKKILSISAYCTMVQQKVNCVRTLPTTDRVKQR